MLKVVGARRERSGKILKKNEKNGFVSVSVSAGERKKTNSVVQNDTVLVFPLFFLYIYI